MASSLRIGLVLTLAAGPALAQTPAATPAAPATAPAPAAAPAPVEAAAEAAAEAPAEAAAETPALSAQEQAAQFFNEGREAFRDKKFRTAADKFRAAYNLDPAPILLYNLARAAEEMGDPEASIEHYRNYINRVGPDAEDRDEVERRIRVMEKTIEAARRAKIRIVGLPPKAKILVDGARATLEDGLVRADPGTRTLDVQPADGPPWSRTIVLRNGQYIEIPYEEVKPEPIETGMSTRALAGWITLGGGAVSTVLGGVFYGLATAAADDRDAQQRAIRAAENSGDIARLTALGAAVEQTEDDYESHRTATYVFLGLGGAALITGATLLILDQFDDGAAGDDGVSAVIVPLPGGLGLSGHF